MSLINNMLLELDARSDSPVRHNLPESKELSRHLQPVAPSGNRFSLDLKSISLASLILAILLVVLYGWQSATTTRPETNLSATNINIHQSGTTPELTQQLSHQSPIAERAATATRTDTPAMGQLQSNKAPERQQRASAAQPTSIQPQALTATVIQSTVTSEIKPADTRKDASASITSSVIEAVSDAASRISTNHSVKKEMKLNKNESAQSETILSWAVQSESIRTDRSQADSNQTRLSVSPSQGQTDSTSGRYAASVALLNQGQTAEAITLLTEALQLSPSDFNSRELLSRILIKESRIEAAEQSLLQGLIFSPGQPTLTQLLARIRINQGHDDLAIAVLEQTDSDHTLDASSTALLALLYQRSGRYQESATYYQRALARQPDAGKWWLGLGVANEALADWSTALQAYQHALGSRELEPRLRRYAQQRQQISQDHLTTISQLTTATDARSAH